MRLSASNLAWGAHDFGELVAALKNHGLEGVEIAPTALWPESPDAPDAEVAALRSSLDDAGLQVSGLQSLLYGQPDLQLFDRTTWPRLTEHLRRMVALAARLDASCAVFGSPRNRLRGGLSAEQADQLAAAFFQTLEPDLAASRVVLTLEPNAPAYGADYLTHYEDVVRLSDLVGSDWVRPQIDTGCLAMVDDDAAIAALSRTPGHVHASAPNLLPPPGGVDHDRVAAALHDTGYEGWVVLEMLPSGDDPRSAAINAIDWLRETYRCR